MSPVVKRWWLGFVLAAVLAAVALAWMTIVVLGIEREELSSDAELLHQESMRLALWRMDSWMVPLLAQEASRPYFEYEPLFAQTVAFTETLSQIDPDTVLTPSPLLTWRSPYFRFHFQIDEATQQVVSPQVPTGRFRSIVEDAGLLDRDRIAEGEAILDLVAPVVLADDVAAQVTCSMVQVENAPILLDAPAEKQAPAPSRAGKLEDMQAAKSRQSQSGRADAAWNAMSNKYGQSDAGASPETRVQEEAGDDEAAFGKQAPRATSSVGPLVPVWLEGDRLAFMREGTIDGRPIRQGILADWPALRAALLAEIAEVFPKAELQPVPVAQLVAMQDTDVLATIPVRLVPNEQPTAPQARMTLVRVTLAIAWLALGVVLLASAASLRASVALGEKRHRFASAVTHELRTPLTTFRMYAEMLADGMVPEEERGVYLETLKSESSRLATLVENVLAYARLEEAGGPQTFERLAVGGLLERVVPRAEARAESCRVRLVVEDGTVEGATVRTDPERVGQIVFNLVDNACKYAVADHAVIELHVSATADTVVLRVCDHGPGISARLHRQVFRPFERGEHTGDAAAGVGLGLALSRDLAVSLGGRLELEAPADGGACFALHLPR